MLKKNLVTCCVLILGCVCFNTQAQFAPASPQSVTTPDWDNYVDDYVETTVQTDQPDTVSIVDDMSPETTTTAEMFNDGINDDFSNELVNETILEETANDTLSLDQNEAVALSDGQDTPSTPEAFSDDAIAALLEEDAGDDNAKEPPFIKHHTSTPDQKRKMLFEIRAAYLHPTNDTFQDIYSGGGVYGAEFSLQAINNFYAWLSADYFHKKGCSLCVHSRTTITFVPVALGIKYLYDTGFGDIYGGVGGVFTFLSINDCSPFVIPSVTKQWFGYTAKVGALFNINERFFIDLFGSYTHTKMDFHNTNCNRVTRHKAILNNWSCGVGVGYRF